MDRVGGASKTSRSSMAAMFRSSRLSIDVVLIRLTQNPPQLAGPHQVFNKFRTGFSGAAFDRPYALEMCAPNLLKTTCLGKNSLLAIWQKLAAHVTCPTEETQLRISSPLCSPHRPKSAFLEKRNCKSNVWEGGTKAPAVRSGLTSTFAARQAREGSRRARYLSTFSWDFSWGRGCLEWPGTQMRPGNTTFPDPARPDGP